jgi:hypothetical protein
MHPRLAELEAEAAAAATPTTDVETPAEVVAEEAVVPEVQPVEAEARVPEEDFYLKLDKRNAYQSLREIADKDESVKHAISTMVGRKASQQYKPELEALKVELEAAKAEIRRREFEKLSDQEVSQRFGTDPKFAREYTETLHAQPIDVNAVKQQQQVQAAFYAELDRADANGVPPQRVAQIEQWIVNGQFSRHPNGQPLSAIDSYRWLQSVVDQDVNTFRAAQQQIVARAPEPAVAAPAPVAAAPVEKRAPTPNLKLQEASPDLSASSHNTDGGIQRISRDDYRRMNPLERMARWQTQGDFEREVKAGLFTD